MPSDGEMSRLEGRFAFTNEGNRTTVLTNVFLKLEDKRFPMHENLAGQKSLPLALAPQETEYRELAVEYAPPTSPIASSFEFETYDQKIGTIERRKQV